jgi:hypothetical protein
MAITYPVDFPTINGKSIVQKCSFKLVESAAVTRSTTNFLELTTSFGQARWEAEITIRPLDKDEAKVFTAFLASLRGITKPFLFGNPLMSYASNVPVATMSSATVGSTQVNINVTSGQDLTTGSHFQYGSSLYMLLEDVPETGGNHLVEISPPLRTLVSGTTSITTNNPKGKWRLASNDTGWDIDVSSRYSFSIACVEVIA